MRLARFHGESERVGVAVAISQGYAVTIPGVEASLGMLCQDYRYELFNHVVLLPMSN